MNIHAKLSKRLKTIASLITPNSYFADIGSDHAYLPCYVCLQDSTIRAIAGEVKKGPFLRAKKTIQNYDLSDRIEVRLGDGLNVIGEHDKIDELVIAGMGGTLITQIIEAGKEKLASVNRIIVQPNTNSSIVRKVFLSKEFSLVDEYILEENNHIYEILVAVRAKTVNAYDPSINLEKQLMFGPLLMKEKSSIFIKKWQGERIKLLRVMNQMKQAKSYHDAKVVLFEKQLQWIEEVLV